MLSYCSASILLALVLLSGLQHADAMTVAERRQYLEMLQHILPPVPSFQGWLDKTGELPPDFDSLPRVNGLPDPLRFLDGRLVRTAPGLHPSPGRVDSVDWPELPVAKGELRHATEYRTLFDFVVFVAVDLGERDFPSLPGAGGARDPDGYCRRPARRANPTLFGNRRQFSNQP